MVSRYRLLVVIMLLGAVGLILPSALLATPSLCDTVSGNLVANCGFETGTFSSWTTVPASSGSDFSVFAGGAAHTGNYAAGFGAIGTENDYIYQNLATSAGTFYDINFWVDATRGNANNQFVANWGGMNFFSLPGVVPGGYLDYNFVLAATSASTQLEFGGLNGPSFTFLDDVTVTRTVGTTPEPSSILLFASALMAFGGSIKRKFLS